MNLLSGRINPNLFFAGDRLLTYPTIQVVRYRKFATIRRFHHHVQIIGNRRLFSTASGGTALAAGTIKDHQDPNLVSLQLLDKEITLSRNFIEWLRGFTDAEGSFMITKITNGSNTFQFKYQISLHIDDLKVLEYIKRILNVGRIKMDPQNSAAVFYVTAKDELKVIIGIFTNFTLNTTKYLDFLSFAEAFTLYTKDNSRKAREGLIHSLRK
jgi:hypothetical protein